MSFRWIRNVIIDTDKTTIEIQLGNRKIGDKCYARIGNGMETYFSNTSDVRDEILERGMEILKNNLKDKTVTYPDGTPYDWH